MDRLRDLATRYPVIGEVRGLGLMIGMELVKDPTTKEPARSICNALVRRAFQNGLLLLSCGVSTVRFMPPLMVDRATIAEAMGILETSLAEVLAEQ
jgi:4-aminobutyrate aminotransferase